MASSDQISSKVFTHIRENSLFTERQLVIISKMVQGTGKPENISSGAYYRQVRQCREKILGVLYSMILLQSTGIIHPDGPATLERLTQQVRVILASQARDIVISERVETVISVIDQLIKRISKL
jgi:hypothetical protein